MKQKLITILALLFFLFSTPGIILASDDHDDDDNDNNHNKLNISGRVYEDKNCNGNRNGSEKGIGGVKITLNPGAKITFTKNDGEYKFKNIQAGTYTITETDPAGYCSTTPNTKTVTLTKKKVQKQDFGDSRTAVSPPSTTCCQ